MKIEKKCEWCETIFFTRFENQRWCSYSCSAKNLRSQGKWGRKRTGVEAPCGTCGTIVYKPESRLRNKTGFYCSNKCWHESRSRKKHYVDKKGYVYISLERDDPFFPMTQTNTRTLPEHRYVMARAMGRCLHSWEQVHHINGVKSDNRIENLQMVVHSHGNGVAYKCMDCGSHRVEPASLLKKAA